MNEHISTARYHPKRVTECMRELTREVFLHFDKWKNDAILVPNSIPILFFGDLSAYLNSKTKIVTVALNPSNREFPENNSEYRFRSPEYALSSFDRYIDTLSLYFEKNPYDRWFLNFEKLLQIMGSSYYSPKNRPNIHSKIQAARPIQNFTLHTDICSPFATSKTWNDVENSKRCKLADEGLVLWRRLIKCINPNIVILSGGVYLLDKFPGEWQEVAFDITINPKHKMKIHKRHGVLYVWLQGFQTPISFKDEHLGTVAERIFSVMYSDTFI